MINALRLGNTGREILNILDALVSDDKSTTSGSVCQVAYKQPTADVIDFWSLFTPFVHCHLLTVFGRGFLYLRGAMPKAKNANYPNLQRTKNANVI